MLDDLNELRTFQRIVALGSLSAAARDLGVGLAVVSKRLASLERRAGVRLAHRTTRSLSATEEGLALLAHVDQALDALTAAELRLSSGREEPRGLLRISAPVSFGRIHIAPIVAGLVERYPKLDVDLRLSDELDDLVEARIDVAVRIGPLVDSTAVMRKLADSHRILVASPAYLDRWGRPRTPMEAVGHRWLRYADGGGPWRLEGPDGAVVEVEARPRLRAANGDVVRDWALAGHGIMLKSRIDVSADLALGRLERVAPGWRSAPAPIFALFPSARHLSTRVRVFIDAAIERLEALGDHDA
ncbi:MAG: LysR substrate-binding domain-containing protein [Caulobacteraceae bacterium]|nr:LysR substrate-binding domain-containing protein [Caulobacteraceae bacterium]